MVNDQAEFSVKLYDLAELYKKLKNYFSEICTDADKASVIADTAVGNIGTKLEFYENGNKYSVETQYCDDSIRARVSRISCDKNDVYVIDKKTFDGFRLVAEDFFRRCAVDTSCITSERISVFYDCIMGMVRNAEGLREDETGKERGNLALLCSLCVNKLKKLFPDSNLETGKEIYNAYVMCDSKDISIIMARQFGIIYGLAKKSGRNVKFELDAGEKSIGMSFYTESDEKLLEKCREGFANDSELRSVVEKNNGTLLEIYGKDKIGITVSFDYFSEGGDILFVRERDENTELESDEMLRMTVFEEMTKMKYGFR